MNLISREKNLFRGLSLVSIKKKESIEDVGSKGYYGLEAVPIIGLFVAFENEGKRKENYIVQNQNIRKNLILASHLFLACD
jgi:hypothetical protein